MANSVTAHPVLCNGSVRLFGIDRGRPCRGALAVWFFPVFHVLISADFSKQPAAGTCRREIPMPGALPVTTKPSDRTATFLYFFASAYEFPLFHMTRQIPKYKGYKEKPDCHIDIFKTFIHCTIYGKSFYLLTKNVQ